MTNEVQQAVAKPKPSNEIDFQNLTTSPLISSEYVSDRLRNKFREYQLYKNEKGEEIVRLIRDNWANLEVFTQDWRLSNINKEEAFYIRYNLDLMQDILTTMPVEFHRPALILLERSLSVAETAQSKGGFLRRMFNSFFQHSTSKEEPLTKRSFFGIGKKNKEGM